MRDPKRIPTVLQELARTWTKYPDMRLCQLIVNVTNEKDPFYVEDDELVERLKFFPGLDK